VDLPSYKMVDFSIVMWLFTRGYIYIHTTYKNGDDWGMVQMALSKNPHFHGL